MVIDMERGDRFLTLEVGDILYFDKDYQDIYGHHTRVNLPNGKYLLLVWGAGNGMCSYGGYATGVLDLSLKDGLTPYTTPIWVVLGGSPRVIEYGYGNSREWADAENIYVNVPGYNGGNLGHRTWYNTQVSDAGDIYYGGGGGTDIRIGTDDYAHRVIVAGGAGGYALHGINGKGYSSTYAKYGSAQGLTVMWRSLSGVNISSFGPTSGDFGLARYMSQSNYNYAGGGAGGGWRCCNSTGPQMSDSDYSATGAGCPGTSFAWRSGYDSSTGCSLDTKYYLTDCTFIGGYSTSMPNSAFAYRGNLQANQTNGNLNSGTARITCLSVDSDVSLFVKINNAWVRSAQFARFRED